MCIFQLVERRKMSLVTAAAAVSTWYSILWGTDVAVKLQNNNLKYVIVTNYCFSLGLKTGVLMLKIGFLIYV